MLLCLAILVIPNVSPVPPPPSVYADNIDLLSRCRGLCLYPLAAQGGFSRLSRGAAPSSVLLYYTQYSLDWIQSLIQLDGDYSYSPIT